MEDDDALSVHSDFSEASEMVSSVQPTCSSQGLSSQPPLSLSFSSTTREAEKRDPGYKIGFSSPSQ